MPQANSRGQRAEGQRRSCLGPQVLQLMEPLVAHMRKGQGVELAQRLAGLGGTSEIRLGEA
eukprot:3700056-Alexandrium_andersonii.AAC.1